MNINGLDSSVFQKLFNRCAALSVMEDAKQTHEAVLAASDLTRYFFESREIVTLNEETQMANLYITHFITDPQKGTEYSIEPCNKVLYVKRMSVLSAIISETQRELRPEKGSIIKFVFVADQNLKLKTQAGENVISTLDVHTF